jgi:hypothetical protein
MAVRCQVRRINDGARAARVRLDNSQSPPGLGKRRIDGDRLAQQSDGQRSVGLRRPIT